MGVVIGPSENPAAEWPKVRRRRVFYIPGYDPIHPRRYRELYRSEGKAQAALSGYTLGLKPGKGGPRYGWTVSAQMDGHQVETQIEVLIWSDIVRESMAASIAGTYLTLARTVWAYIASGAFFRLMWLRKGPMMAALYPVLMLLVQAALAGLAGALGARLLGWGLGKAGLAPAGVFAQLLWWLCFGAIAFGVLVWFRRQDSRFFAYYLMHDYSYSASWRGAYPAQLEERLAAFRSRIAAALTEDYDEVLVVGHSSGAHLGASVLADLLWHRQLPPGGPVLSFLTLGQVVPMVSFLPEAGRLRRDLQEMSAQEQVFWLDVTAPGDGCCFALCDPAGVSGVAPARQTGPLILSAAFTRTLSPARWKALRWRFFRLHFQYLCAFDNLPGKNDDYDYFRITAGPQTLKERYGARRPSGSRIDRAASGYRSLAPRAAPAGERW